MTAKVGYISVATHPRESRLARVCVNGLDVTSRCYAADDVAGFADCYVLNGAGRPVLNAMRSGVARERLAGAVVIEFPNGLD